jgi:small conductance mechanosensitive channel
MEPVTRALQDLLAEIIAFLPNIITSLIIFIATLVVAGFASRFVKRALTQRKTDPEITLLLSQIARWGLLILGTTIALQQINFDLTAFLTGLGILGFTIGFAIQDVSKNFIAGLLLLLEQPFDIGDAIEVGGFSGTVEAVELRATQLKTFDGKHVLIPNSNVFTNPIVNYSRTNQRRVEMNIGIAYNSDLDLVQNTTLSTLEKVNGILEEPAPLVVFNNFAASSIDFTLYFWVDLKETTLLNGTTDVVKHIKTAFEENRIEIPYPIQIIRAANTD